MKRPYHVLSVVPTFAYGGDEHRLVSIVRSLNPQHFRSSLVALPQANHDVIAGLRPAHERFSVPVHQLSDTRSSLLLPAKLRTLACLLRRIRAVARLARESDVDLIDARLDGGMLVGVPAAILSRKPSVVTLYDLPPCAPYSFWRVARGVLLNLTNAVITDSAIRRTELKRWIVNPFGSSWNIPNGTSRPEPVRPRADLLNELKIPADPNIKVIAQISSIVPYKGHMVLLEAARKVIDSYPNAFFLLIGYSRHYPEYRQQVLERIQTLGIGERVRVHAYPGPIGDIWQVVDIQVHASLIDSLPNAILEGMALGMPAVVTSVGGVPDAVEHEKTGLVVPPNKPDALARALLQILNNPQEAAAMGQAARVRHAMRYRPDLMAKALEQCYFSVIDSSGARMAETG
jgi:glycosyltransferase involved in cell wall biosynthesis